MVCVLCKCSYDLLNGSDVGPDIRRHNYSGKENYWKQTPIGRAPVNSGFVGRSRGSHCKLSLSKVIFVYMN